MPTPKWCVYSSCICRRSAGAAGLSAARTLIARGNGQKITILERSNRRKDLQQDIDRATLEWRWAQRNIMVPLEAIWYTAVTDEYGTGMFEEGFTGA